MHFIPLLHHIQSLPLLDDFYDNTRYFCMVSLGTYQKLSTIISRIEKCLEVKFKFQHIHSILCRTDSHSTLISFLCLVRVDHSRFGRTLEVVFILCLNLLRTVDLLGFFFVLY